MVTADCGDGSACAANFGPFQGHMSQKEFDELGYPKVPDHWTKDWMLRQIELEKVDPRVNPNLLLDETHQEFWDNASRKPYAKAILRSEQHWLQRRKLWLRQYEQVALANMIREELAAELEACPPNVKRQVMPILKYKITEIALTNSLNLARAQRLPLSEILQRPEQVHQLQSLRLKLEDGGSQVAEQLLEEYNARATDRIRTNASIKQEEERSMPVVLDSDSMAKLMNQAQKLRKDGYIEWHKGAVEEAFRSWCEAEAHLYRKRLPEGDAGNAMVSDLHCILLKNIAQAAIKLGHWSDALRASEDALAIDDEDPKAWFRRRYPEAKEALEHIESLAVGRPDRARLVRDVGTRRERIDSLTAKHTQTERLAMCRALKQRVFAEDIVPSLEMNGSLDHVLDQESEEDDQELQQLEEELMQLEMEDAVLNGTSRAVSSVAPAVTKCFAVGDRVQAREMLADVDAGHWGTVVDVDGDGDIKVLFDGQDEAQLIFSVDFSSLLTESAAGDGAESSRSRARPGDFCLTHDGASDLLDALLSAYQDPGFQQQVAKLARDVRWDVESFRRHLPKVALGPQKEALLRFGFEASLAGAGVAQQALEAAKAQASTRQRVGLQKQSDDVTRTLFGEMYRVAFPSSDVRSSQSADVQSAVGHFPTASEAFHVVVEAVEVRHLFNAWDVLVEYADGGDASEKSRRLVGAAKALCPPCGWQRIWRISCATDVLWDRHAMLHKLPGTTDTLPSVVADAHAAGLSALPAAVLARILLSCDLTGLCCLAAAASLFCLGSSDVGEAMPLPCEKGPDRWLSFARASLLWADLLACLHLGSAKVAQRFQQLARQARVAPSAWITGSGQATAASFSACMSATITAEASCAAMCPDAAGLMATGHEHGIRLWGMPEMSKLGVIRTRSPVVALDLGRAGDFLAAIQTGSPVLLLCMWDLTSEIAGPGLSPPLWSMNVSSTSPLSFERCAQLVSLGASSTEVAAATADGRVLLWKLVDRTLLAIFPAFTVLDFENLSWSVGQAEMAFPAQLTQMVVLEEVLVVACNLGQPGDASAGCVLTAWHTPTGTRLPHPWHLAGPLEASASRHSSSIPVFLPGRLVGQMAADPSLRHSSRLWGHGVVARCAHQNGRRSQRGFWHHVWQDREIKFDQMPQLLKLRKGEFQIDSINSVEDTKGNNGERGILIVTNLRLIWTSAKYARTNLSIGFNCVSSVNIRTVNSKLRGNSQALYVMTRFNSTRFEFIFTSLVKHSPRLFTTVQAVFKSYETTKLYRDLKLRGAIIRDKELVMLPNEQVYEKINGIWNLSSDQGNLGTFIITNVRTVWFAVLAENFNVSIPYLQMKSINVRNSKFGQALVIETTASSGGYILGFRADPVEHLEEVYTQIHNLWKIFSVTPIFGVEFSVEDKQSDGKENFVPRQEDDVQIMEGDDIEPCLLYQPDGEKEIDREPIYNNELGLAVERLKEGSTIQQLWQIVACCQLHLRWRWHRHGGQPSRGLHRYKEHSQVESRKVLSRQLTAGTNVSTRLLSKLELYLGQKKSGVSGSSDSAMTAPTGLAALASYEESGSGSDVDTDASDGQLQASSPSTGSSKVSCALEAFRCFDAGAELHGSQVLGLADEASDVDILSSKPVHQLLKALRNQKLQDFELSESVMAARIPRVIVRHKKTGLLLDVVESCRDPHAHAKDALVRSWLDLGADVRELALDIKGFARAYQSQLPREQGYPNTFLLLLSGFWWLATHQGLRPGESRADSIEGRCKESSSELFRGWLDFIAADAPRVMNLAQGGSIAESSEGRYWQLVEPVSGRTACAKHARSLPLQHLVLCEDVFCELRGPTCNKGSSRAPFLSCPSTQGAADQAPKAAAMSDGNEISRRELERQIQELRRDKVKLDDSIRKMESTQKRIFGEEGERARLTALHAQDEKKEDGEQEAGEDKKDDDDDKKEEKKEEESEETKKRKREDDIERRKKEGRPTKADPRSRNLFGKLLGHLHSAKDRLQKEKTSKMGELQQKALSRVEDKVNLNKMNIKEFRKGQFEKQLQEEQAKAAEIEKQIEEKEVLLLQRRLENHYSLMMNFIRTEVQPTIFFLPNKHTRDTEKQLEESRDALKNKIATLRMQFRQEAAKAAAAAEAEAKEQGDSKGAGSSAADMEAEEPQPEAAQGSNQEPEEDAAASDSS
eukprot:s181_g40.t1